MSFVCLACGRQRAGSGFVCRECQGTDTGKAAILLPRFPLLDEDPIRDLGAILERTRDADRMGSLTDRLRASRRWNRFNRLLQAARAYRDALDDATPQSHQEDW